jgi:iron complex outermembrane receptor protein
MLYASWTKGYKPGGINNAFDGSAAVLVTQFFDPETAQSLEIGTKSRFLDNRVSVNAAGFYSRYKNMQYLASDPFPYQDGTANIPNTNIWGGELEAQFLALDNHLRLNMSLTGLGGRFTDNYYTIDAQSAASARAAYEAANPGAGDFDPATIAAVAAAAQNTKGNTPPKLPKWTGSVNAAYMFNFGEHTFTPRAEWVYRGAFDYRVFNNSALDNVSSYGIFNLYLEYLPPVHGLKFSFAATNLGNKVGIGGRFTDPYGSGQTSNEFIAPRQFVFSAGYGF